ncbi:uncharacterized protein LOC142583745 [Dermacentor variabilis]|uniref:uncharacterized protein LOC142583745 n=1 Tax=Dermacentor variabilis TaxID=34621 RepID=UPI003F5C98AB
MVRKEVPSAVVIQLALRGRRRGETPGEFQEATPREGQPPDQQLKTGRRVADPSHQDFTRLGPPANLFQCVARLPERTASCSRPASFCACGQDETSRATGPSSRPAARPERRLRLSCRLLPKAGVRASVPVGRTRAVGLRARALRPAARPGRRRLLLLPPSRLSYLSKPELARSGRPVNHPTPRPLLMASGGAPYGNCCCLPGATILY